MVQFIGCTFQEDRVQTTVVDRKANLLGSGSVSIPGLTATAEPGVLEVPPPEWIRSGSLALQDAHGDLPPRQRKIWGLALSGPQGWIAVDPELQPISPLRLTPGASPFEDLSRWVGENRKLRQHVFAVLSPRDYFRLRISGSLASELTHAAQTGCLDAGATFWSEAGRLGELDLEPRWLPPVFHSRATTGRLTEEGIELTGIPAALWVVAGADSLATGEIAAGRLARDTLYVLLGSRRTVLRRRFPSSTPPAPPPGWDGLPSALPDHSSWQRVLPVDAEGRTVWPEGPELAGAASGGAPAVRDVVLDTRHPDLATPGALEAAFAGNASGISVSVAPFAGQPEPGGAFLAGLAHRSFRDPGDLYRRFEAMLEQLAAEADTGEEAAG